MKGMLWLDDDKKTTLDQKVQRAAEYYKEKYGRSPTICQTAAVTHEVIVGGVKVVPGKQVRDHFLLGVGES